MVELGCGRSLATSMETLMLLFKTIKDRIMETCAGQREHNQCESCDRYYYYVQLPLAGKKKKKNRPDLNLRVKFFK